MLYCLLIIVCLLAVDNCLLIVCAADNGLSADAEFVDYCLFINVCLLLLFVQMTMGGELRLSLLFIVC